MRKTRTVRATLNHEGKNAMKRNVTRKELLARAKAMRLSGLSKKKKHEIIHALQLAEGNTDCFQRIPDCAIEDCLYRAECVQQ